MPQHELRAEIYSFLSEALKPPTAEFVAEQAAIAEFLDSALTKLGYALPILPAAAWELVDGGLPAFTAAYHQSFLFPLASRVVPVESLYRVWTSDAGAEPPPGADQGMLMSDHALHMLSLLASYGLALPPAYRSMPDHLALELEFAAFLLARNDLDRHAEFIREHLDWLGELAAAADKQQIPVYYLQVVKLTAQFLAWELRRPKS